MYQSLKKLNQEYLFVYDGLLSNSLYYFLRFGDGYIAIFIMAPEFFFLTIESNFQYLIFKREIDLSESISYKNYCYNGHI